jgi:hypothetical protein
VEPEPATIEWMRDGFTAEAWLASGIRIRSDVAQLNTTWCSPRSRLCRLQAVERCEPLRADQQASSSQALSRRISRLRRIGCSRFTLELGGRARPRASRRSRPECD